MEILSTSKEAKALDAKRFIAGEVNMSRLPFFASSTKGLKKKTGIAYRHLAEIEGRQVEVLWEVTANAKYGYPGPLAEAVHTAIMQMVTERGFPVQNPISFTIYDICKRLGFKPSGRTRRKIRNAILSTRSALIEINQSFATKDGRRPSFTDTQNLYPRVIFFGDQDPETGEPVEYSAVWLADFYVDSLNRRYFRPLDFEYFKHIRKASYASTKLYRYLGYRFSGCFRHNNEYSKVDYDELAIIVDVKRQPNKSLAKQKLDKAHRALLETDFLAREPVWQIEHQTKGKPPKFYILYYPGKRAREEYKRGLRLLTKQLEIPFERSGGEATPGISNELTALGVTENRAVEIAKRYTEDEINLQLDHLAYLGKIGRPIKDNVGGWLADAIEKGYTPPKGFKTREEHEAQRKAQTEAEAQLHREAEKERRTTEREKARYSDLDNRLATLPTEDQQRISKEIETRIRAGFDDFMRGLYTRKPFDPKSALLRAEYYKHLEELL